MDMNYKELEEISEILKALAHPVRLCIAKGLLEKGECNVSHMQSCLEMPQSTVSQHIQKLKSAGIIEGERNGLEINYSIKNEKIRKIIASIINSI
ncbi:MAG: ArsR/SmtB family transcription factor [Proteocatella sp.]